VAGVDRRGRAIGLAKAMPVRWASAIALGHGQDEVPSSGFAVLGFLVLLDRSPGVETIATNGATTIEWRAKTSWSFLRESTSWFGWSHAEGRRGPTLRVDEVGVPGFVTAADPLLDGGVIARFAQVNRSWQGCRGDELRDRTVLTAQGYWTDRESPHRTRRGIGWTRRWQWLDRGSCR